MKRIRKTRWYQNFKLWLTLSLLVGIGPVLRAQDAVVQATIQEVANSGTHPEMRWPKFPYYRDELTGIYGPRNYDLFWFNADGVRPLAERVIAELSRARENGLDPETYDADMLANQLARIRSGQINGPKELALFDTALSMGLLRYISDLRIGRVNPKNLHFGLNIEGKKYDLAAGFNNLTDDTDMRALIDQVQPMMPIYSRLKEILPRYEALAAQPGLQPIPVVEPVLNPGDSYGGLDQLAQFLIAMGDLEEGDFSSRRSIFQGRDRYEGAIVDAVKRYQFRHGLDTDGVVGPATFRALNVPLSERVRSIKLGLERLRWLPELGDAPFVAVNIPGFQLFAFERGDLGNPALVMNVIVGSAINRTKTPIFSDEMTYLDFSPYWNVPMGIAKGELLPKIRQDPTYLARSDLELVPEFGNDVKALPVTQSAIEGIASGKTFIRQRPGPQNALGLVKFIFPNSHNVYLHSTPQQELFSQARRDFSHGCIRIEKPGELAQWVLRDKPEWNRAQIDAAMDGERPRRVFLSKPLKVLLFYTTVVARSDGNVFFYPDIYGHDTTLEQALAKGYPYDP